VKVPDLLTYDNLDQFEETLNDTAHPSSEACTSDVFNKYLQHYRVLRAEATVKNLVLYRRTALKLAFQGRTHFLVGDSISKQSHEALGLVLSLFFGSARKLEQLSPAQQETPEKSYCLVWESVQIITCWLSAKGSPLHANVGNAVTKLSLATNCTSVVLNAGLHYLGRLDILSAHVKKMTENIHVMNSTLGRAAPTFFWRETTPQFFPGGGSYTFFSTKHVRCEQPSNSSNVFNFVTNPLLLSTNVTALPIWNKVAQTALPWVKGFIPERNVTDCTHFCFLAPIWDDINNQLIEELTRLKLPSCSSRLSERINEAQFLISAAV